MSDSGGDLSTLTCGQLLRRFRQQTQPRPDEVQRRSSLPAVQRRQGLTQEELEARSGVSARGLREIESGRKIPTPDTIRVLAAALELLPEQQALFRTAAERERARRRAHRAVRRPFIPSAVDATAESLPLVGRERELELLDRHLAGEGLAMLVFAGEPGIGKSRLLREAAVRGEARGWRVLRGGCQRRGGEMPYAPLLDALKLHIEGAPETRLRAELAGCAWLARLLPELAAHPAVGASLAQALLPWPVPPEQERRLMFDAVARFLSNVANYGPRGVGERAGGTLLVLDDLQWAGQDALDLLIFLLRSPSPASGRGGQGVRAALRVVGAYRDNEAPDDGPLAVALADLASAGLVAHHTLAPLPPDEAARLYDQAREDVEGAEEPEGDERDRAVRRSGGVPFFVLSLARAARRGEPGDPAEDGDVPWGVAQVTRGRVTALPGPARAILGVAAVAGRRSAAAFLATMIGWPEGQALAALDAASRARLLDGEGAGVYAFAHDIVREAVEAGLDAGDRMALHRRAALALEAGVGAGEPPVEELAYHYGRSDDDEKAALYLERAGDRAAARAAYAAAEGYYREAIGRLERLGRPPDAARVREKVGTALRVAGRFDAALAALDAALETYRAAGDQLGLGRVTATIGHAHMDRGTLDEGMARVLGMLVYLQDTEAWHGLAALYLTLALLFFGTGRYQEQLVAAEQAAALGREVGDEGLVARAESGRGHALLLLGRLDEAVEALAETLPRAEAVGDLDCLSGTLGNLVAAHMWRGEFARSHAYVGPAIAAAERLGSGLLTTIAQLRRAILSMYEGDWGQAHADLDWVGDLEEQVAGSWVVAYPLLALGTLCVLEGEGEKAGRYLGEVVALATRGGEGGMDIEALRWATVWLAELALRRGRPEEMREMRDRLAALRDRPELREDGWRELDVTALLPRLAWAHLELGDTDAAAKTATESVERARGQEHRIALADALWVRGLVAARQAEWEDAVAALDEALSVARAMPYPYAEARVLETYGMMRHARGETGEARERLGAALAIFDRLGAREDAARVRQATARAMDGSRGP